MKYEGTECIVEGCHKPRRGAYCSTHENRVTRHGDPHKVIGYENRNKRGEDSPKWVENPGYSGWHQRLQRIKGPASEQACACGETATGWAYTGPREPGERMPYRTDETLYVAMCTPCHRTYDLGRITT
jgi:hypothetical protein